MKKATHADEVERFEQIPNVGPSIAQDFRALGLAAPAELKRADPQRLYDRLCALTGKRQDPCVLDTFHAAVDFMNGGAARPWWHWSRERLNRPRAGRSSRS